MTTLVQKKLSWTLPDVEVGDIVLAFRETGDKKYPAVVVEKGERVLGIAIVRPDAGFLQQIDAARYVDDPDLKDPERRHSALWEGCIFELPPQHKALIALKQEVEDLKNALKKKSPKGE